MNVYTDKPDLTRFFEAEGIRGVRRDQYAMIGVRGGPAEIPKLEIPWWDIEAREWRIASLPSRIIEIEAPEAAAIIPPPADSEDAARANNGGADQPETESAPDGFWKRVSQLIAAAWLLTVVAWWWSSRDTKREPREPEPPPIYKQQAKFVKAARKAAAANDKAGVRAAIIEWGRLQWPDDAPRSIGDFANRVTAPLSDELFNLSASSYSSSADEWDGKALAKALRSIKVLAVAGEVTTAEPLPPLMPPGI
jgi:hypothetical protein